MDQDPEEAAHFRAFLDGLQHLCAYDPRSLAGLPIGMFHCPACGCMVLAGVVHPPCDPNDCWLGSQGGVDLGDPGPGRLDHIE